MSDASHAGDAYLSTPTPTPSPRAGHKPSGAGSHRVRVRYCECDPMGVAHHAAYIPWLEEGRTELLRTSGISYADLERAGVFLVITRLEMKYRRPVLYDDVVEIRTKWVGGSRVKIEHEYEVVVVERGVVLGIGKKESGAGDGRQVAGVETGGTPIPREGVVAPVDQTPVAVGSTTLACVGRDGRPMPLPEWLMPADVHPRRS